tara:strand:- start:1881 stop:2039 length:159 start_codon:yes stop_codon:yes gene_type:complete
MSIRDLIEELQHVCELIEDEDMGNAIEELENQTGTIQTLLDELREQHGEDDE